MIQSQNNCIQSQTYCLKSLNRLEAKMSHLVKIINDKNKETLPNTLMIIPNSPSNIVEESWYFEDYDQDSISPQNFELDQYQTIDKLASFYFNEIELEDECGTNFQCCDSVSLFESMLTLVSLPELDPILMATLILIPI